jgi:hypothetical protein
MNIFIVFAYNNKSWRVLKMCKSDDNRQTMSYNFSWGKEIRFTYSFEKNLYLKATRGVNFVDAELAIVADHVLDIIEHPNSSKYPNQKIYILNLNNYIYLVPFIEKSETEIFLKTIYPSRKLTKKYFGKKQGNLYEKPSKK